MKKQKKEKIKVLYSDNFNILQNDDKFSYCMVDKDLYNIMKRSNYKGNISIYFYDKNDVEYGFTIDNINSIKEI